MVLIGGACVPRPNKAVMCECVEIDEKIEYYRLLASRITDPPLLEGIKGVIEQLQALKVALQEEHTK
jgi:hypothetical protein